MKLKLCINKGSKNKTFTLLDYYCCYEIFSRYNEILVAIFFFNSVNATRFHGLAVAEVLQALQPVFFPEQAASHRVAFALIANLSA